VKSTKNVHLYEYILANSFFARGYPRLEVMLVFLYLFEYKYRFHHNFRA